MTAPELVEVVAKALYRSVVSFPGELHPTLSELPKRQQDKYHHHARAVLAALTEAGTVEWGMQSKTFIDGDWDRVWTKDPDSGKPFTERKASNHLWLKSPIPLRLVSRLTLPWERADQLEGETK